MLWKLVLVVSFVFSLILVLIAAVPGESSGGGELVYLPFVTKPSPIMPLGQLLPANPVVNGRFGWAVDVDGDTAVVTTYPEDDVYPTGTSGTLYIFEQVAPGSWALRGQFSSDGMDEFDWYGVSVAVSGSTVAVGASRDDEFGDNAGAIYLYEKAGNSWLAVDKITADDVAPNDDFGIAVALEGNTLVAGAQFHAGGGTAYAFEKNGGSWQQVEKFVPELPDFLDMFGSAVSLYQNTLVVGMRNEGECPGDPNCSAGAVYVYEKDGTGNWNTIGDKLRPQLLPAGEDFGRSVAMNGDVLSIGANQGSYIFEKVGGIWLEITRLSGEMSGDFGRSTAVMGNYVVVGAPNNNSAAFDAGAVYLFGKDGNGDWQQVVRFVAEGTAAGDHFGWAVAAFDDFFAVSMPWDDGQLMNAGSVFIFRLAS